MSTIKNNPPAQVIEIGFIRSAIWSSDHGFSVSFTRSFKKDGEWQTTNSFFPQDLPVLEKLCAASLAWIMRQERGSK